MLVIAGLVLFLVAVYLSSKRKRDFLKQQGKKVPGRVIANGEMPDDFDKLGGNIYNPTVQFTTIDDNEITGRPVTGFTTQGELPATFNVIVYYNPANAYEFHVEI